MVASIYAIYINLSIYKCLTTIYYKMLILNLIYQWELIGCCGFRHSCLPNVMDNSKKRALVRFGF